MSSIVQAQTIVKPRRQPQINRKRLFPWMLVLPALVVLAVMGLAPLFYVLILSVTDFSFNKPLIFVGAEHFIAVAQDGRFWKGMAITSWFVFISVGLQLVLGMASAWSLARIHNLARYIALTII